MPAYSIKVTIHNQSSSNTLRRVDLNACEGGYTDGWGTPPAVIPPNQSIAFQAESTGPLKGCKGYVKYECGYVRIDGSLQSYGFFCFFWDVPVVGNSSFNLQKAHLAIGCDCDGTMTPDQDESQFPSPLGFDVGIPIGDGVPNDGDGHNNLDLYVVDVILPGFTRPQPDKYGPFNNPTANDWSGHWSESGVDILITKVSGDTCTVAVKDTGASPQISFTQSLDFSQPTGSRILEERVNAPAAGVHSVITNKVGSPVIRPGQASSSPTKEAIGVKAPQSSAAIVPVRVQNTLRLEQGVVLTLMQGIDETGASRGTSIHYQVASLLGKVSRDIEVGKYVAPPR